MKQAAQAVAPGAVEETPPRRPDSETYVRDETLEGPADPEAEAQPSVPAALVRDIEKRGERLARLARAAVALLKSKGMDVTRATLAKASEEIDDDPTRVARGSVAAGAPAGMPPASAPAGEGGVQQQRARYRGFVESVIDSNKAVRGIYEANAKPSNLAIGKKRGRKAPRKRNVLVVPAHVMRRLKQDIARDYLIFRRLAERRRLQLVHANAVILELRKVQHRRDAKGERDAAPRDVPPSYDT